MLWYCCLRYFFAGQLLIPFSNIQLLDGSLGARKQ